MKTMRTILLFFGLAVSLMSSAQQHIYRLQDSAAYVVFYDTTTHIRTAQPKNSMGINATSSYISVYTTANRYLVADWNYLTVVNIAPTVDSAIRLLYNICFRIDTGTSGIQLNYDPTTFLNGEGAWALPKGSNYWSQSGSDTWLTDTTHNVGIGTSKPKATLHVRGSSFFSDSLSGTDYGVGNNPFTGNETYYVVKRSGCIQRWYINGLDGFDDATDYENLLITEDTCTGDISGVSAGYDVTYGGAYGNIFINGGGFPELWVTAARPLDITNLGQSIFYVDSSSHTHIIDGTQGDSKVFTSDSTGKGSWKTPVSSGGTGSEPSTPYLGQFYFDTTLVKMKFWNGTVWAIITSTP